MKSQGKELVRVGLPVKAVQLRGLIDALDPSGDATVRVHNAHLIIEEPEATLPLAGSGHVDAGGS